MMCLGLISGAHGVVFGASEVVFGIPGGVFLSPWRVLVKKCVFLAIAASSSVCGTSSLVMSKWSQLDFHSSHTFTIFGNNFEGTTCVLVA